MGNKKMKIDLFISNLCLCFLLLLWSARGSPVNTLSDSNGDSVVSDGGRFELGFFSPHGSSEARRYVGIWYHDTKPEVVVSVANRNQPLYNNNGIFTIKNGNLKALTSNSNDDLWSTHLQLPSDNTTMELMDSGNLVLKEFGDKGRILWQSFQNPTDKFLPGMNMIDDLMLTSWKTSDDPSLGHFTFLKDTEGRYIIEKLSARYWVSKELWQNYSAETDGKIAEVIDLLSKLSVDNLKAYNYTVLFQNQKLDYNYTRAVMNSTGKIQYLARNRESGKWDVIWSEPENICSLLTTCGTFASCRSDTKHTCKCLPGFEPKSKDEWDSGDYSNGCQRKSEICIKEEVEARDFLTIHMMVRKTSNIVKVNGTDGVCQNKCLESCTCKAYAEISTRRSDILCAIWEDDLQNIWEDYYIDRDVNIRIKHYDIEYTRLDCEACGSSIIPYPLSTGPNCGDPMYRNFYCALIISNLFFQSGGFYYGVTNIDSELNTFTIATNGSICRANDTDAIQKLLKLEHSSTFKVSSGCNSEFNEIDIQWEKPLEPICNSPRDCTHWPNSLCNSSTDGTKRCLCNSSFNWNGTGCHILPSKEDGFGLSQPHPRQRSTRVGIIVAVTIVGLIVISCLVLYSYYKRRKVQNKKEQRTSFWRNQETTHLYESEKRIRDFMGSGMFGEDDRKAIEVPVFDLETLLIATGNFSEANKIGRGGFGTVYKGLFPGGLEIAIKRLSQCSAQGVDEFKNEAILIAKLQHRNLVRLLGYCVAGEEKMLVYEYMPNKSLDSFMFGKSLTST